MKDVKFSSDVLIALALKCNQLQRTSNINIEKEHLIKTLRYTKWKDEIPSNLNDLLSDIFAIEVAEIVRVLTANVIRDSKKIQFDEFEDLIGG